MNLKRTATLGVGGAALAAWLSAAMTPGRPALRTTRFTPSPIDASGVELASEINRLHERLRPTSPPNAPSRNPFTFGAARRPSFDSVPIRQKVPTLPLPTADAAVARENDTPRLTLAGVAEDRGVEGPVRTAIVSGDTQLFLVKEGDTISEGGVTYEVGAVTADSVELIDLRDASKRQLTLK
jgi:hypothetical protein